MRRRARRRDGTTWALGDSSPEVGGAGRGSSIRAAPRVVDLVALNHGAEVDLVAPSADETRRTHMHPDHLASVVEVLDVDSTLAMEDDEANAPARSTLRQ